MSKELEIYLKFQRLEITSREWEAAEWRWEFLRLNDEHKKEYPGSKSQRKPIIPFQATRWGNTAWLNPNLSFEELHKEVMEEVKAIESQDIEIKDASKYLLVQHLGALDRAVYNDEISPFPAGKDGLCLYINLSYPDNEIKDQVMAWVAKYKEQIKKPKSWVWDKLPLYHQAISLKMSGKTANEIADSVPRSCTGDEGLVPRRRFAGAGSKAPQAASVKSRGGKRWGKGSARRD